MKPNFFHPAPPWQPFGCWPLALTILLVSSGLAALPCPAGAWQAPAEDPALVRVEGLVLDQQKYSFTLRGLDRDYHVVIPNGTPMLMQLPLPRFDFEKHRLSTELLVSATDGDYNHNLRMEYPLPDPVYLSCEFESPQALAEATRDGVRKLDRYVLSSRPFPPSPLALQGELKPSQLPGQYKLEDDVRVIPVRLGPRKGYLANSSIMELRPNETAAFVEGRFDGDALVARQIRFQHVGDPFARFDPDLPNALVIGDLTSINYDRALRESLQGKVNVHHPPCSCGGSKNWRSLSRWLANPNGAERHWDVIAFNFGLQDKSTSEATWKSNLKNAIDVLRGTDARLVWITTTPVPRGLPEPAAGSQPLGLVQGRMALQNGWARDVLKDHPEIMVCDLWQLVEDNAGGTWDQWWAGRNVTFNNPSARPLGQRVAESILAAADRQPTAAAPESGEANRQTGER